MACVATWSFGLNAVRVAKDLLESGSNCTQAVESGINCVEDDPNTGVYFVGRGCCPNKDGIVQLDAGIMRGSDCSLGAVCALEGYACPISVARHIMEHSPHNILVGAGARKYAEKNGFALEENNLLLSSSKHVFQKPEEKSHDTLSMLCLDNMGQIAAGVSTSGPPCKLPGRVGDSPLPGCGYYADSNVGAAAATGNGEKLMQYCPSYQVVQTMKNGYSPQEACEHTVKSMTSSTKPFEVGLIALNMKGEIGAYGTVKEWKDVNTNEIYHGFPYAVWIQGNSPVLRTVTMV